MIRRTMHTGLFIIAALALTASLALAQSHTSKPFSGAKVNGGTVTHSTKDGKDVLTLSDDFKVPDTARVAAHDCAQCLVQVAPEDACVRARRPNDEEIHASGIGTSNPEQLLLQNADGQLVEKALSDLPVRFREILVLRELEGLSYKEIVDVMGVPMGTVMSTLSRARDRFRYVAGDLLKTHLSSDSDSPAVKGRECVAPGNKFVAVRVSIVCV